MAATDRSSGTHFATLTKSTVASVLATGTEFILLPILIHLLYVAPAISYFAVQFVATIITFLLNKYWAFDARFVGSLHGQGARTLAVFGGSLALNTAIPSLGSYVIGLPPVAAFAASQVIVFVVWNYPMNRFWVFRA